jgi:uroporphyrinogen-III synthase
MAGALDGIHVVVTRPAHQAEPLCELIEQQGGQAIRFPVLEIVEPRDHDALFAIIDRLANFDLAIFISPNAVHRALNLIDARGGLPPALAIAAVGRASAKALAQHGCTAVITPQQKFDSEALLTMGELQQVTGKRIVIFRGEGGRELLADTLRARGAQVDYAECYRRAKPDTDVNPLLQHWVRNEVDIIIVTSNEGLHNLYELVGELGRQWLMKTPLVVVSERTAELARQMGFTQPSIIATKASDDALLQALIDWAQAPR